MRKEHIKRKIMMEKKKNFFNFALSLFYKMFLRDMS